MEILLKIVHVFACVMLVLVVLLQAGRGGGMGAAFGGASAQIFGGRGASNFLSRVTSGLAVVFFLTSLSLSMMSSQHQSVMRGQTGSESDAESATLPEALPAHEAGETSDAHAPTDENGPARTP